mgnify:FL=1
MSNREKPNLLHIAITSFITTIISLAVSVGIQWLSLESVVVTISPSSELDGKYLTVISVQNLEESTLSNLSLYFDTDFDVLEIKSSDEFEHQKQYVELEQISPKAKYSVIVWTEQPISKGQIIAESDYKTRLDYSNDSSPFLLQILWFIVPFAFITFLATSVQIWVDWKHRIKESQKNLERCNELQQETERIDAERQSQKAELESLKKVADKSSQEYDKQMRELKRDSNEMRLYLLTRISQLHKELSFWRDTVRKMLYNSQNEFQTADKVIDTVTSTLKTYTTRGRSDDNMDEMLYLAQLIADSRELHSKHDSTDSQKDT